MKQDVIYPNWNCMCKRRRAVSIDISPDLKDTAVYEGDEAEKSEEFIEIRDLIEKRV